MYDKKVKDNYIILKINAFLINSGQPVASKQKEGSDVGVVSNVAIYSLKA